MLHKDYWYFPMIGHGCRRTPDWAVAFCFTVFYQFIKRFLMRNCANTFFGCLIVVDFKQKLLFVFLWELIGWCLIRLISKIFSFYYKCQATFNVNCIINKQFHKKYRPEIYSLNKVLYCIDKRAGMAQWCRIWVVISRHLNSSSA